MPATTTENAAVSPLTLAGIGACVLAALAVSTTGPLQTAPHTNALGLPAGTSPKFAKASAEAFIPNMGQWDAQALFLARSPGVNTWVTENGVVYDFHQTDSANALHPTPDTTRGGKRRGHVVRMEFVGGIPSEARGEGLLEGRHNYFLGNGESRWATDVPRYAEARSERVYDGVEARWYYDQARPRYDLIVAPGASPDSIQMRFEGVQGLSTDGQALRFGTSLGDVQHARLFAYQKSDRATRQVPCEFVVRGSIASFKVGEYDRTKPLIIDPIVWASFLGGDALDFGYGIVLDSARNPVIVGSTASANFPTSVGAYDPSVNGNFDAFVSKLSSDGSSLLFSTYLGGSSADDGFAVALHAGNIVVVGETDSTDFPTSRDPYDATHNGLSDAFLVRLSSTGSTLLYGTFFGGSGADGADDLQMDVAGDAWIVGTTSSTNLPTTDRAYDRTHNGSLDVFVAKLDTVDPILHYGTFLGGSSRDEGRAIVVDGEGSAHVTGYTNSTNFPTTLGAFSTVHSAEEDCFVTKLTSNGGGLSFSTYLGGDGLDVGRDIALTITGEVVTVGTSSSSDLPTPNGIQKTYGGARDAFVAMFEATGSQLLYATYLGGSGADSATAVKFDSFGNAVVVGSTDSPSFPTTAGSFDASYNGSGDGFIARLYPNGTPLKFASFVGGLNGDALAGLVLDSENNALVVGSTLSFDFPVTVGAFDESKGVLEDAVVAHIRTAPSLLYMGFMQAQSSFVGGFAVPIVIGLNQPADFGDTVVTLTTNNPGKVFVSQTKVKAGKKEKQLGIRTETVREDTPVTLTATCNGVSRTINFTLRPGGLLNLRLNPTSLSSFELGSGRVTLSAPAPPDGRSVLLSSSDSDLLFVPESVGITPGKSDAVFPTFAGPIAASANVTVFARLGTMQKSATITVNP